MEGRSDLTERPCVHLWTETVDFRSPQWGACAKEGDCMVKIVRKKELNSSVTLLAPPALMLTARSMAAWEPRVG